jgi:hypothetical protein
MNKRKNWDVGWDGGKQRKIFIFSCHEMILWIRSEFSLWQCLNNQMHELTTYFLASSFISHDCKLNFKPENSTFTKFTLNYLAVELHDSYLTYSYGQCNSFSTRVTPDNAAVTTQASYRLLKLGSSKIIIHNIIQY